MKKNIYINKYVIKIYNKVVLNFGNNCAIKGLGKIMPTIGYTISFEESTNIVKKAILWNAGVYPLIYEKVLVIFFFFY